MFCCFLPFRRSMEMLCSCWKARWWWNIWGWSWGLHWNSATTSTNSNRAGCDSRLTLRQQPLPLPPHFCRESFTNRALFLRDIRKASGFFYSHLTSGCHLSRSSNPPAFTEVPKLIRVHSHTALILHSWSSLFSIAVNWKNKRVWLANSSEPNCINCISSKTLSTHFWVISDSQMLQIQPQEAKRLEFCFLCFESDVVSLWKTCKFLFLSSHALENQVLFLNKLKLFALLSNSVLVHHKAWKRVLLNVWGKTTTMQR